MPWSPSSSPYAPGRSSCSTTPPNSTAPSPRTPTGPRTSPVRHSAACTSGSASSPAPERDAMDPFELRAGPLTLDRPGEGDIDRIAEYCQDPLFERFLTIPWPYERQHAEHFVT